MQFFKLATVFSFAAAAVAAPAPVAAPEAALEARTVTPPNACKVNGKYTAIGSACPTQNQFFCYQANGILNILNINCVLNGNTVNVPVNVNIGDIDLTLLKIILNLLPL